DTAHPAGPGCGVPGDRWPTRQSAMALPSTATTTTATTPRLNMLCCTSLPRLRSILFLSWADFSPWPRPPPAGPAPFVVLPTS
ncbi:unnamed protein product, partial [Ectocarpus sp. 4 AP-2014]